MAYSEIADALKVPAGATDRFKRLNAFDRLLDGTFYDDIAFAFEQEKLNDEYLPLTQRRPSVKFNLARIVIDQSSGSLWTDDEIAKIVCGVNSIDDDEDGKDQRNADAIFVDCQLDAVMMQIYERSACGSGAIIVDVDPDTLQPTFNCLSGKFVRPIWSSPGSQKLAALEYVYPTTAKDLRDAGYDFGDDDPDIADSSTFWLRVMYMPNEEIHFHPLSAYHFAHLGEKDPDDETKRIAWRKRQSFRHKWGVVPAVYVRNLLFGDTDDDGRCPFADVADIQVEIARLASQVGRGFRYAADPLLVRDRGEIGMATKGMTGTGMDLFADDELRGPDGETVRSVSNVLEGSAKLLEITGTGLKQCVEYIKVLREWALEVSGAMKADAASAKGVMSGRALDMLEKMLRLLVKRQRIAYGQRGLLPLMRLLLTGCKNGVIDIPDVVNPEPTTRMRLEWPKDSLDDEMLQDELRTKINNAKAENGVLTPNEWRDELGLPKVDWGDQPYLTGKGPWTGGSALGTRPDNSAATPEDDIGAVAEDNSNQIELAKAAPPKPPVAKPAAKPRGRKPKGSTNS